jgi:hypothetical protein
VQKRNKRAKKKHVNPKAKDISKKESELALLRADLQAEFSQS